MKPEELKERNIEYEFEFRATRSSGPGGQNVNKVNTKVEIRFNIEKSSVLTDEEKSRIMNRLKGKISSNGELITISSSFRSQLKNKEKAIGKLLLMISKALTDKPVRIASERTNTSIIKRLDSKRIRSSLKKIRQNKIDPSEG